MHKLATVRLQIQRIVHEEVEKAVTADATVDKSALSKSIENRVEALLRPVFT